MSDAAVVLTGAGLPVDSRPQPASGLLSLLCAAFAPVQVDSESNTL